jgi:hypothetical protein
VGKTVLLFQSNYRDNTHLKNCLKTIEIKVKTNTAFSNSNVKNAFTFFSSAIAFNDLRADEGRETEALNCKPNTNLKEISELSNYCEPAAFVCTLLAVVFSPHRIR